MLSPGSQTSGPLDAKLKRKQIVDEAMTWLQTPYHLGGWVKGAGADCYSFIASTMVQCGVISSETLPVYSHDWFSNTSKEEYLLRVTRYAKQTFSGIGYANTKEINPGDIVITKVRSKIFNHGCIVIDWPWAIHAVSPRIEKFNAQFHWMWACKPVVVFDPLENP